jgi:hypothetical protein
MGLERFQLHSQQAFQEWLAADFEVREELVPVIGDDLDPDIDSLDVIETFLLARYPTPDDALTLAERGVLDAVARHVGLVMILELDGATWTIELEDADRAYYRLPVIGFPDGFEDCPLTMATAAIDRRSGEYLRDLIEGYEELYPG